MTQGRGLRRAALDEYSASRREPKWYRERRLDAYQAYENLPLPQSRYTTVRGLELDRIHPFAEPVGSPDLGSLPGGLGDSLNGTTPSRTLTQIDAKVTAPTADPFWKQKGVIFTDLPTAVREYPDLVQQHLFKAVAADESKMTALAGAFTSGGVFLYVPRGVVIEEPLQSLQLIASPDAAMCTHTLVIAEEGSKFTLLEESYSLTGEPALQTGIAEVYLGEGAQVQYGGVQSWNPKTYNFLRRCAQVGKDAQMSWTIGWLGGRLTVSNVESRLAGPGAQLEDIQVMFGSGSQHFDLTSSLRNMARSVRGEIHVKGAMKDRSRSVIYGFIRVDKEAQQSNSYQLAQGLLLNPGAHCDAIPGLEIEANDVRATHGASIGPIDEEQIFYLQSRGLSAHNAKRTIVDGFFAPTIDRIPVALVRERFQSLVAHKWD